MPHQCTNCSHVFPDGSKAMLSGCPDCGGNTFQFLPKGAIPTDESGESGEPEGTTPSDPSTDDRASATSSEAVPLESAESVSPTDFADSTADSPEPAQKKPPSRGPVGRATAAVREWVRVDSPSPTPRPEEDTRSGSVDGNDGDEADRDDSEDDATGSPTVSTRNDEENVASEGRSTPDSDTTPPADLDPDVSADVDVPTDTDDGIGAGSEDRAQADARRDVVANDELPSTATDRATSEHIDSDPRTPPSDVEGGRIAAEPSGDRPDLDELRRELNDQFESIKIVAPGQYELNLMELYNREEYIIALREDGRYAIEAPETWLGRRSDRE